MNIILGYVTFYHNDNSIRFGRYKGTHVAIFLTLFARGTTTSNHVQSLESCEVVIISYPVLSPEQWLLRDKSAAVMHGPAMVCVERSHARLADATSCRAETFL